MLFLIAGLALLGAGLVIIGRAVVAPRLRAAHSVAGIEQYGALRTSPTDAPELISDSRFTDPRTRSAHSAELKSELARRLAGRSAADLEGHLGRTDRKSTESPHCVNEPPRK